jgi:hypothetical protein
MIITSHSVELKFVIETFLRLRSHTHEPRRHWGVRTVELHDKASITARSHFNFADVDGEYECTEIDI